MDYTSPDTWKTWFSTVKSVLTIEQQEQILELREFLLDLRNENLNLKQDLKNAEDENARLRGSRLSDAGLQLEERSRWYVDSDNIPHCPACAQNPESRNPVVVLTPGPTRDQYNCPVCGWSYSSRGPDSGGRRR